MQATHQYNKNDLYILPSFYEQLGLAIAKGSKESTFSSLKSVHSGCIVKEFKKIRYIPLSNGNLDYEENVWDLNDYALLKKSSYLLHFDSLYISFRDILKNYVLFMILSSNIKLSSLADRFKKIRRF